MITAWSYSRFRDYEDCPRKAKYKYVDKLKEPGSPAMERGSAIHKTCENYVSGATDSFGEHFKELVYFGTHIQDLKEKPNVKVELQLAFKPDWTPTGWFERDCWLRVKMDVMYNEGPSLFVVDYKTGQYKPGTYTDQLEIYALAGFMQEIKTTECTASLWFLDTGDILNAKFNYREIPDLRKKWDAKVEPMLSDREFCPRQSASCRWCSFSKAKGGPCEF